MKTSRRMILVAAYAGTFGLSGLAQAVQATQAQPQVSVMAVPGVKALGTALNLSTLKSTSGSPIQIALRAEASSQLSYSTLDAAQRLNLTLGQKSIVPALDLAGNQEAQTQPINRPTTSHYKKRITNRHLTPRQRQRRLMRRHTNFGGH